MYELARACARTHTPTHTHMRTCAGARTHTHIHTHIHTYTHTHTHTHAHTHTRTHAHTHTRTHAHTHTRTHAHTHIHANARTHAHTCEDDTACTLCCGTRNGRGRLLLQSRYLVTLSNVSSELNVLSLCNFSRLSWPTCMDSRLRWNVLRAIER